MIVPSKMRSNFLVLGLLSASAVFGSNLSAHAEGTVSIYGGVNFSPNSSVKTNVPGVGRTDNGVEWDGDSFEAPPYYGIRATWWFEHMPEFGVAIDFTHAKIKADLPTGFTTLEFTDGINFLTANALYRKDIGHNFTPYVGLGVGLTIPNVEVDGPAVGNFETNEYQVTGVAFQGLIGVDYKFTENWSVFGEFKSTYGVVDADLEGGGSLETDIISNQIIIGVTYKLF